MEGRGLVVLDPGGLVKRVHGGYSDSDFVSFRLCLVDSYDTASHRL
jgi:hypothetical protein